MYRKYYGLRERPFSLTSNPRYLLLTPTHAEGLSTLQYGITSRRGIVLLTGEAGTGKTTIVRAAVASQAPDARIVLIDNPVMTTSEFLLALVQGFGLTEAASTCKPRLLAELRATLKDSLRTGRATALIVDEAHVLSNEILDEIRLLSNIETDDDKLLPVVLVGQPELANRLNEPALRQLKQRIELRCALSPLESGDTIAYIASRIRVAGGNPAAVFTSEAVELIHEFAQGLPRVISVICDNALVTGFAKDERPVGPETVSESCRDLDLQTPEPPPRAHATTGPPLTSEPEGAQEPEETSRPARSFGRFFSGLRQAANT